MPPPRPPPLVEGVDYYLEGDKFVFTASYHLKRGYCCNSKCRHCPYGDKDKVPAPVLIVGVPPKLPTGGSGR
jgi:hypothetical protein